MDAAHVIAALGALAHETRLAVFRMLVDRGPDTPGVAPMRAHTYYETQEYQAGTPPRVVTVPYEDDLKALRADIDRTRGAVDVLAVSFHWGVHFVPRTAIGRDVAFGDLLRTCQIVDSCAGLVDGTSGAPWINGSTVTGVIGGLHGGGCAENLSYSSPFDQHIAQLFARAQAGGPGDAAPQSFDDEC